MPQENGLTEAEELELLELEREKAFKQATQDRQAARARANGIEPNFVATPNPQNQTGAAQGFAGSVDRFVDSVENYDPQPDAGIKSPADAFLFKGVNALTGGALQRGGNAAFEGTVQEGFGDRAVRASDSFPVGSTAGQMTGMAAQLLPVQRAAGVLKSVPGIKQAVDLAGKSRLGSYAGRLAAGMGAWTGETALQGATTLSDEASAYTGEKPTLESRAGMAKDLATMNLGDAGITTPFVKDVPVNVLGPLGTSFVNRAGVAARTGGASVTPKNVRQSVQESTGRVSGGPEQMRGLAQIIDAELAGGLRPQAISAIHRLLKGSGLSPDDIGALNSEVRKRANAVTGATVGRKSIGQLYDEILNDPEGPVYRPQASLNVTATLRERRMNMDRGDGSAGIIGGEARALRDSQKTVLDKSAQNSLGTGTRLGLKEQVKETKSHLSAEYERILAAAPTTGPGADLLRDILKADPSKTSVLRRRAKNAGMSVDEYIDAKPYEAGHWMRSRLSRDARSATGREQGDLLGTVEQIDEVLDSFDQYAATKQAWGSEESLLEASTFGDKLFGSSTSSLMNNDGMRAELVAAFHALPDSQKPVAMISIRDAALAKVRGGPTGQPARISAVTTDAAIDFFNEIGVPQFADDLRAIKSEQGFLNKFDPEAGPRTAPNQQAIQNAPGLYGSTLSNAVRADGQGMGVIPVELAASQFAPGLSGWYAAYRGLKAGANKMFDLRNATKEDMTRFLMARPGRQAHEAVAASAPGGPLVPTNTPGSGGGTYGPPAPHASPAAAVAASRGERAGERGMINIFGKKKPQQELQTEEASRLSRAENQGFSTEAYHGTPHDFDTFTRGDSIGIHVGTKAQANDIASIRGNDWDLANGATPIKPGSQILPLRVRAQNSFRMDDLIDWQPEDIAVRLHRAGVVDDGQLSEVRRLSQTGSAQDRQNANLLLRTAMQDSGYDSIVYKNTREGIGTEGPQDSLILLDPKQARSRFAAFDPANVDRAKMSGMINIDGKPMRRKDALKQVSGDQFPPAPGSAAPPPRVTPQAAVEASGSGIMDSPLPILAGMGAAGTAGVVLHNQMSQPPVAGAPVPGPNPFLSSVTSGAKAAQQAAQQRQADGFPPPPRLKPDLAPVQKAGAESANQDAKSAESARRHEYYRQLSGPESVLWNQIHQQRAGELKVTPEDRQRGVSRKRLRYGYEIPVESLSDAPVEELIGGKWVLAEAAPVGAR